MPASSARYVISVLVRDRVGILRDITAAVTDSGGHIHAISQTVVEGYFTVILSASYAGAQEPDRVSATILANFGNDEASVVVRPWSDVKPAAMPHGDRYVLTVSGPDRPDTLKTVTRFLAAKGINIEDWYVLSEGPLVIQIGQVVVPAMLDIKQMQQEFGRILDPLGLTSRIQHENIFRATNEIGPIRSLLEGVRHD